MRMSEEDFDKVIDVNLKSVLKTIQRTFLKKRAGSIINMSVVGVKGMQDKLTMPLQKQVL
jgi:3-oxoacyl-[acyl-carrier protein] reductase